MATENLPTIVQRMEEKRLSGELDPVIYYEIRYNNTLINYKGTLPGLFSKEEAENIVQDYNRRYRGVNHFSVPAESPLNGYEGQPHIHF